MNFRYYDEKELEEYTGPLNPGRPPRRSTKSRGSEKSNRSLQVPLEDLPIETQPVSDGAAEILFNKYAMDENLQGNEKQTNSESKSARFSVKEFRKNITDIVKSDTNTPRSSGRSFTRPAFRHPMVDDFSLYDDYFDDFYVEEFDEDRPVPIWLSIFLVGSYIFGGAFLFQKWENWTYLNSTYFCFITLTTIGFGDFVPAQDIRSNAELNIALCSIYLLFGIALLVMSFNLVQDEVVSFVKDIAKSLGIIKDDEDIDEDDD